jgi:hypothetical protein
MRVRRQDWKISVFMICAIHELHGIVNAGAESATVWQVIISGIGARTIVSKPVELNVAHKNTELGVGSKVSLKDIFG